MSQVQYPYSIQQEPTNNLAIVGLVVVIVGIFFGGLLTPVGLIISLVALGRPGNKGAAWAGVILGFIFTCLGAIIWIVFGAVILASVFAALGLALLAQPERLEVTADMGIISARVEQYEQENDGILPANLTSLGIPRSQLIDPWGNEYRYLLDDTTDRGFTLVSNGPDGKANSEDDIALDDLGKLWSESGHVEIIADGDDQGGRVRLRIGDQVINISGGEDGGRITISKGDETYVVGEGSEESAAEGGAADEGDADDSDERESGAAGEGSEERGSGDEDASGGGE